MNAAKILSTGALAVGLTLGGLSVQAGTDSHSNTKGDAQKSMQGAEHKCGSGNCGSANCGASKPDEQTDKKAMEKQMQEKNARSKGASHSCGAGQCG